jgi:hypothetical protein
MDKMANEMKRELVALYKYLGRLDSHTPINPFERDFRKKQLAAILDKLDRCK